MPSDRRKLHVERTTSTAHRLSLYDGDCGNIHGHNLKWDVQVITELTYTDNENMPVDFKDIAHAIDKFDHAAILSEDDPLVHNIRNQRDMTMSEGKEVVENLFGDVFWTEGDPTCELIAGKMIRILENIPNVHTADVSVAETDQYGLEVL